MAYSPRRPVSWTVVSRPGLCTLIAIEHPQDLLVVRVGVVERAIRVEDEVLLFVEDRRRREAVELVAAGPFHRVDDGEPAAEAEGPFRGVGAGPYVLGHLHLLLRRDELVG